MKNKEISPKSYSNLFDRIANILVEARTKVVREINKAQVLAYWEIGREIIEFEQKGKIRAEYGEELIKRLSKDMTEKFGKGFSDRNLEQMRKFYLTFPQKSQTQSAKSAIRQTPIDEFEPMLSWSHYCELLKIEEPLAFSFYEQEAVQNKWSVRELKRQVNSMLFERLALSKDTKAVMKMAKKGKNVGRLHRHHDNKQVVQVYDYVDVYVPTLMRMYKKRVKGYEAIGYTIINGDEKFSQQPNQYEYVQSEDI